MNRLAIISALLLASFVGTATATQYSGWGDTGWIYASKYDCCNQAIAIASQYSAQACYTAGGSPQSFAGGGQRGRLLQKLRAVGVHVAPSRLVGDRRRAGD